MPFMLAFNQIVAWLSPSQNVACLDLTTRTWLSCTSECPWLDAERSNEDHVLHKVMKI